MKLLRYFAITSVAVLVSCEDPISIEFPREENFVVLEGWVTNQPGPYRVKLSQTLPFNSEAANAGISGAVIEIVNHRQERFPLHEDADAPGEYLTDSASFIGVVGHRYTVQVQWAGKHIVSTAELMREVPEIDTITYSFVEDVFVPETISYTSGYLVTGFVVDPDTRNNYYRWKLTENGVLHSDAEDLILITDRFFNGKRFGYELSNVLFQRGDTVSIEQFSLNQGAFDFLRNLNIQAVGLGKATSTPPSLVRGNLSNLNDETEVILGYFGASCTSKASVIIEPLQ